MAENEELRFELEKTKQQIETMRVKYEDKETTLDKFQYIIFNLIVSFLFTFSYGSVFAGYCNCLFLHRFKIG